MQTDKTDLISKIDPGQEARPSDRVRHAAASSAPATRAKPGSKLNDLCPRPFYYGQIRVDPNDSERIYVLRRDAVRVARRRPDVPAARRHRASMPIITPCGSTRPTRSTWSSATTAACISLRRIARRWEHCKNLPIGQFYGIGVDMRKPYRVYGGLQDNGTWGGPSRTQQSRGHPPADWFRLLGADGFQCRPIRTTATPFTPRRSTAICAASHLRQAAERDGHHAAGRRPERPPIASTGTRPSCCRRTIAKTVYYRRQPPVPLRRPRRHLGGDQPRPDARQARAEPDFGHTLTTIAESPRKAGVLYTGSDDGLVHVTSDGGRTWTNLSDQLPGVPPSAGSRRIECSPFDEGTAFLSLVRHRNDDRQPYLFKTDRLRHDLEVARGRSARRGADPRGPLRSAQCRTCSLSAPSSACSCRSTAAPSWQRLRAGLADGGRA